MGLSYPLEALSRPLPWQTSAWQQTQRANTNGRLAHALLLSGSDGTGRNQFAIALARQLLCTEASEAGNCGQCKGCELTRRGAHADLATLMPVEPGKSIGIDAVRGLLNFAAKTSSLGLRKVILVSPLEAMTTNAFNAFLKGLEEPGDDSYFLLVYGRGQRIPATVRSRCQTLQLPEPTRASARDWLDAALADNDLSGQGAEALLDLAADKPLRALAYAARDDLASLRGLQGALEQLAADGNKAPVLAAAAGIAPLQLLEQLQIDLQARLRGLARSGKLVDLRGPLGALETLTALRVAQLSGSNPNPDLLRFSALDAYASACEALQRDGKLVAI